MGCCGSTSLAKSCVNPNLEPLATDSADFRKMCEQFYSEMKLDHPQIRIHAIDRITNPLLQEQADKWRASKGLANIAPVEMWHGTGPRGVRGISRRGFDLAFAHGGTCGNAVYLAYSPRAAHGYAAMRKDLSSHHTIILCSATLGQVRKTYGSCEDKHGDHYASDGNFWVAIVNTAQVVPQFVIYYDTL